MRYLYSTFRRTPYYGDKINRYKAMYDRWKSTKDMFYVYDTNELSLKKSNRRKVLQSMDSGISFRNLLLKSDVLASLNMNDDISRYLMTTLDERPMILNGEDGIVLKQMVEYSRTVSFNATIGRTGVEFSRNKAMQKLSGVSFYHAIVIVLGYRYDIYCVIFGTTLAGTIRIFVNSYDDYVRDINYYTMGRRRYFPDVTVSDDGASVHDDISAPHMIESAFSILVTADGIDSNYVTFFDGTGGFFVVPLVNGVECDARKFIKKELYG